MCCCDRHWRAAGACGDLSADVGACDHLGMYGLGSILRHGFRRGLFRSCGVACMGLSGAIWVCMGLSGIFWGCLGLFRSCDMACDRECVESGTCLDLGGRGLFGNEWG